MAFELDHPELIPFYQTTLEQNGLANPGNLVTKVSEPVTNLQGENYGSVCRYFTVHLQDDKKFELFVKEMPTNEDHASLLKKTDVFSRETDFFLNLLKDLRLLYKDRTGLGNALDFFPKCLYGDEKQVVLENLVTGHGYYLSPKFEKQDLELASMMLENLAKFHATGYVLISELGEEAALKKYMCLKDAMYGSEGRDAVARMFANAHTIIFELLNNCKVTGIEQVVKFLEPYGDDLVNRVLYIASPESKHVFRTVNHGDCWNNNMLFQNDETTKKLKHHVFVDFQCTRISSPNMDLTYFIFSSVKQEVWKSQLNQLLDNYFQTLKKTVEILQKSQFSVSFEQFLEDFKEKVLLGLWVGLFMNIAMDIMAKLDMSQVGGGDLLDFLLNGVKDWIQDNPDLSKEKAVKLVAFCQDFEKVMNKL